MKNNDYCRCRFVICLILLLSSPLCQSAIVAGEVATARGRVTAATAAGQIRLLMKGDTVHSGDTLITGPGSYVRIKFTDDSFVILRPNTRFVIDKYRHTGKATEERAFFRLLRGGFRSVTGYIAKLNREKYQVKTAVATIGIRGTDFQGRLCEQDCQDVYPPPADGLYVGVTHNDRVAVSNAAGQVLLGTGDFAFVAGANEQPVQIARGIATPLIQDPMPAPDPNDCPTE